jgi:hypothetical protein
MTDDWHERPMMGAQVSRDGCPSSAQPHRFCRCLWVCDTAADTTACHGATVKDMGVLCALLPGSRLILQPVSTALASIAAASNIAVDRSFRDGVKRRGRGVSFISLPTTGVEFINARS